jgi:O-methyltransferase
MKRLVKKLFGALGFDLVRRNSGPLLEGVLDLSQAERDILWRVAPYTMTSVERIAALITAVNYISANRIPGNVVECGVWRGGSMMATALTLLAKGDTSRSLYLYDTFEGMPVPSGQDQRCDGASASDEWERFTKKSEKWCHATLEEVRDNMLTTGYPRDKIFLLKGMVEQTIPRTLPGPTALLRLDTDWYESTKHELLHLFPLLQKNGILILDDYGFWQGAKKAVDEYFAGRPVYLHRIDVTGRVIVKTAD